MLEEHAGNQFPAQLLMDVLKRSRLTPFYRDRFSNLDTVSLESWNAIPLTTKKDLRDAYPFGLLGVPRQRIATYHESSGTSGKPIASYFTDVDWTDIQSRFLRSRVNITESDMVLVKTPYSLVTTALQMHGAARLAGATVIPADNRSGNMPYSRVIRLLHELPVTVAWCLPTEALIWAYLIKRRGLDPASDFPNLRALIVAGEVLSPAKKKALARIWGGKEIIEDYGSTETGSLAGECVQGCLHVWGDRVYCETAASSAKDAGSLIVTPLFREAMPLVRYDMEDQIQLSFGCACGSSHPRIEVFGRRNQLIRSGSRRIYPKQIENAVYSMGGDVWFWRARALDSELNIEVCGDGIFEPRLRENLQDEFGIQTQVRKVSEDQFVHESWLADEPVMQKPRFIFRDGESWEKSLSYF